MKLEITNQTLSDYEKYYFKLHPKAKKKPIEHPYHPSINVWFVMKRLALNTLKQKWHDFIAWWINDLGLSEMKIEECKMRFVAYYPTKRRADTDNSVVKFILDGMVAGGLIVDDDYLHLTSLTLECGYDKANPRTEIYIDIL
jgi:Holliday junction resolvase RusA-like endonuclease